MSVVGCRASLGSMMSHIVYGNRLVRVVFVSTLVKTGRVRVEFFQPVRVTGRVSVDVFFVTLNPNPILTQLVDTICQAYYQSFIECLMGQVEATIGIL